MILVDTSVWIDHFRNGDARLTVLLEQAAVLSHPFVVGELAMGNLRQRDAILTDLRALPQAIVAQDDEVMRFVNQEVLFGMGIGYVDAHLLAATRLTPGAKLWTRDRRLDGVAERLGMAAQAAS